MREQELVQEQGQVHHHLLGLPELLELLEAPPLQALAAHLAAVGAPAAQVQDLEQVDSALQARNLLQKIAQL